MKYDLSVPKHEVKSVMGFQPFVGNLRVDSVRKIQVANEDNKKKS